MIRIFKCIIVILILSVSIYGCKGVYYVGETTKPIKAYSIIDTTSSLAFIIPTGTLVLSQKKSRKYHYVICDGFKGYVYKPNYKNYHRYNSKFDGILYGYSTNKTTSKISKYNSTSSSNSNSGISVKVKSYYRKNGTFVKSHTRSSKRK